jgi:REP element-mobilizing transposase RayT
MSKGNLDDFILSAGKDKGYFVKLLGKGAEKYRVDVFAYCIMGNHYHLLARTQEANLPDFMHFLLSSYASYMAREGRKGHIFAGRYKAILIDTEEYLLTVSKYIHLNPIKTGMVQSPSEYKWSGYRYYFAKRKTPDWFDREWVNDYFGPGFQGSLDRYREFVEMDMDKEYPYPQDKVVAQTILGDDKFVKEVMKKHKPSVTSNEIAGRRQSWPGKTGQVLKW